MTGIFGGYDVTLDAKGRFLLPAGFKKQLSDEETIRFYMTKEVDGSLNLFTEKNWIPFYNRVSVLNSFNERERVVKRFYLDEAAMVEPDSAGRLLVPAHLKEFAGLQKDLKMCLKAEKVEIWDSNKYKQFFDSFSLDNLSRLTSEVLGGDRPV
ncbi:MAG TPA: division/cell wall cluster transcriptional repressor MraZ [Chitinophagaceae bacterium]|nr:division/cell wall cluster transcriptional repressor MraZ [Chitinophagaceae bacterium]